MRLADVNELLDPAPLRMETGYERLEDGVLHVAVRTDLRGCSGRMVEWWFRFRPDTQQYIWWHPVDHVFSTWDECTPGTHIGSIHRVRERTTGLPERTLSIQFRDPVEFFDAEEYAEALRSGSVSAAVCGRTGISHDPPRTSDGRILGSRLLHVARDKEHGCVLRSHFFVGQDLPEQGWTPSRIAETFTDEFGRALLMHSYNEFTYLSRFLPSLYTAENRNDLAVELPW